jgi:DNA-binding CsgD family transcriptional regulator/PAS domain-containing protein
MRPATATKPLANAIDRLYATAGVTPGSSFPCGIVAALFAPARVLLWTRHPDIGFLRADPSHRLHTRVLVESEQEIFLGAVRVSDAPCFARREIELFDSLVPHLTAAIWLHWKLARAEQRCREAAEVLDRLNAGVAILDGLGRVLFANRRANEILASDERLVADFRATPGSPVRHDGRDPLVALALPLPLDRGWIAELSPAAVLVLTDPQRAEAPEPMLTQSYGLTPAEASLATALLSGEGLPVAAARLEISLNTAKTHRKRILAKTEAGDQGGLIRLICNGSGLVR